jgi:hypothetical protein
MKSQQSFRITGVEHKAPKAEEVCENSGVRPRQGNAQEEIQSQPAMTSSGSSVVPLARMPVLRTEPSDKLCSVSIPWWRARQNKTANTYVIDISR